jgi:trimethylamine--corrinoid protein Co-methyltransferase
VKYLAELASLAVGGDRDALRTQPPIFVAAYCTTSPLKLDTRSCEVLQEALKYGFPVNFAPMPILGATAPMTPAGAAIVAAAEILGCMTATSLIDPDVFYFSTSITGEMDMKTTQVCYGTPAAILTDAALHQLFRRRYGLVHNVEPGYVEARVPGLHAAFLKTYRQMAFGCTASLPLPIGALDNAAAFSPTQAMIDLEMNEAIYRFARGIEVNDDTCAVDLIDELLFCEQRTYLESEHTLAHFREVGWNPRLFDRSYFDHTQPAPAGDERILKEADQTWRRLLANHPAPTPDPALVREVDRIVAAAKNDLLAPLKPGRRSSSLVPRRSVRHGHAV